MRSGGSSAGGGRGDVDGSDHESNDPPCRRPLASSSCGVSSNIVFVSVPESKRSPGPSRRSRRETKPLTPEKINQETEHTEQNETEHIKIRRINTNDTP